MAVADIIGIVFVLIIAVFGGCLKIYTKRRLRDIDGLSTPRKKSEDDKKDNIIMLN